MCPRSSGLPPPFFQLIDLSKKEKLLRRTLKGHTLPPETNQQFSFYFYKDMRLKKKNKYFSNNYYFTCVNITEKITYQYLNAFKIFCLMKARNEEEE